MVDPRPSPAQRSGSRQLTASIILLQGLHRAMLILALLAAAPGLVHTQSVGPDSRVSTTVEPESEPTLAVHDDTLVAISRASRWVSLSYSRDGGQHWTDGGSLPTRNPYDYFETAAHATLLWDGEGGYYVSVLYEDTSTPGSTVAVYRGALGQNGLSWTGPFYALPSLYLWETTPNLPYDSPRLAIDPDRSILYLSYTRYDASPSTGATINLVRSLDQGATWTQPQALSSDSSSGSSIVVGPEGNVYVLWEDYGSSSVAARLSVDQGQSFGPPVTVGSMRDNLVSGPPEYYPPDRRNPIYPQFTLGSLFYGFPALAVDRSTSTYRGRLYAAWAEEVSGDVGSVTGSVNETEPAWNFASAIPMQIGYEFSGASASSDFVGYNDYDYFRFEGQQGQEIDLSGQVGSVYPYGTPAVLAYELLAGLDTLAMVTVAHGLILASPLPSVHYTLPYTGSYYVRVDPSYGLVGYDFHLREFFPHSGEAARDQRDIVLAYSDDHGATWSPKVRVDDAPVGLDESLPALAVDHYGIVHLAWYDHRNDPEVAARADTYWRFSRNGGASFSPSIRVSSVSGEPQIVWTPGDHMALVPGLSATYCLWADTRSGFPPHVFGAALDAQVTTATWVSGLEAKVEETGVVVLRWMWEESSRPAQVMISRRREGEARWGEGVEVGAAAASGRGWVYRDSSVAAGQTYEYLLTVEAAPGGERQSAGPVRVEVPRGGQRLRWGPVGPNPFREQMRITLVGAGAGSRLSVCDLAGRMQARLGPPVSVRGEVAEYVWTGRTTAGMELPSGVYWVVAEGAAGQRLSTKVVLVRR